MEHSGLEAAPIPRMQDLSGREGPPDVRTQSSRPLSLRAEGPGEQPACPGPRRSGHSAAQTPGLGAQETAHPPSPPLQP